MNLVFKNQFSCSNAQMLATHECRPNASVIRGNHKLHRSKATECDKYQEIQNFLQPQYKFSLHNTQEIKSAIQYNRSVWVLLVQYWYWCLYSTLHGWFGKGTSIWIRPIRVDRRQPLNAVEKHLRMERYWTFEDTTSKFLSSNIWSSQSVFAFTPWPFTFSQSTPMVVLSTHANIRNRWNNDRANQLLRSKYKDSSTAKCVYLYATNTRNNVLFISSPDTC